MFTMAGACPSSANERGRRTWEPPKVASCRQSSSQRDSAPPAWSNFAELEHGGLTHSLAGGAVCPTGRRRCQLEKRVRSSRREDDDVGLVVHEAEPRVLRVCRKRQSACHSALVQLVILHMLRFRLTALACKRSTGRSWSKRRSSSRSSRQLMEDSD